MGPDAGLVAFPADAPRQICEGRYGLAAGLCWSTSVAPAEGLGPEETSWPDCLETRVEATLVVSSPITAERNTSTDAELKGVPLENIPIPTAERNSVKSRARIQIRRVKPIRLPMTRTGRNLAGSRANSCRTVPSRRIITRMDYKSSPRNDSTVPSRAQG